MESSEQLKQRVLNEKRLTDRLRLATTRLADAQQQHVWAIAAAKSEGLSIRKIAAVTGLSSSRVHQLLHTDEALQIPEWLNSPTERQANTDEQSRRKGNALSESFSATSGRGNGSHALVHQLVGTVSAWRKGHH